MAPDKKWHVDKTIPIAFIVTIAFQSASALWWASKVESIVDQNVRDIKKLQEQQKDTKIISERLVRVEVLLERIIDELKGKK